MAPKKKQQEKMTLGNFLSDQNYGSWAEEMDEMPLPSRSDARPIGFGGGERREFSSFSRDRDFSDRGPPREALPLPTKPPYTAHLGNLSFDTTGGDIEGFFAGCQVTNVRLVEDKLDGRPKGFGYVEFETLDGLKSALDKNGAQFQGRNVKISVAEPRKLQGLSRLTLARESREIGDWTRKGPLPDLPSNTRRPSARGFDNASDAGSDKGSRRQPAFEGDGRNRDFGNWERKGPLSPSATPTGPPNATGTIRRNERSFERRESPSWGEGKAQEGPRPPRREYQERPSPAERTQTAAELDSQWRSKMRPDAPVAPAATATPRSSTPDPSVPSSPVAQSVPAVRPRLNLAKRTVSEAPPPETPSSADPKASPFGAARPIDTATRDREIADKRAAAAEKAKEEAEAAAKAKAEKQAAAAAAKKEEREKERAETGEKTDAAPKQNGSTGSRSQSVSQKESQTKENGAQAKPTFEILRRVADGEGDEEAETQDGGRNENANGDIIDDKEVKPQEVVAGEDASTAEEVTADGWTTVPERVRKGRRDGNSAGVRAVAS